MHLIFQVTALSARGLRQRAADLPEERSERQGR
ncbi:hypothetical protein NIES2100_32640 [Calothrix sp. NIES-2100]|nr:hypothetical protein NIES2100_32640 [Calothrix sp. NIES-2100]